MANFIEMWMELRFPWYVMIDMDRFNVLYGPFPSHRFKIGGEIGGIHYIGAHIKTGKKFGKK